MATSPDDGGSVVGESRRPHGPIVFNVGETGHRALPGADFEKLSAAVVLVLAAVRASATAIGNDVLRLRLFTSLAEGADSLVAEQALLLGYALEAPFPFPRQIYADDFHGEDAERWRALTAQASAVVELAGDRAHGDEAYLAAGRVVLDHSDLLLAVWDGKAALGVGGTGQIVEEASLRRVPVVIIDAAVPHGIRFLNAGTDAEDWRAVLDMVMSKRLGT